MTHATVIECASCGRMVGGLTLDDARKMWNAAMAPVEKGPGSGAD